MTLTTLQSAEEHGELKDAKGIVTEKSTPVSRYCDLVATLFVNILVRRLMASAKNSRRRLKGEVSES
jgi:hypothetical protein